MTQNFFSNLLSYQNNAFGNWLQATKDFQQAAISGEAANKGAEIYQQMLNKQMSDFNNFIATAPTASANGTTSATAATSAEAWTKWLEKLKEYQTTWSDKTRDFMNQYLNQTNFNPFDVYKSMNNISQGTFFDLFANWTKMVNNWFESESIKSGSLNTDLYKNLFSTSSAYFKMYEIWQPIYQAIASGNFKAEDVTKMFDLNKFRDLMEKTFEYVYPSSLKNSYSQALHWFDAFNALNKEFFEKFYTKNETLAQLFPYMSADTIASNPFNLFEIYKKSTLPMFRLFSPERLYQNELFTNSLEKFVMYGAKLNELQFLVYNKGQKVLENLFTETSQQFANGGQLDSYTEFFQTWLNKSEKEFIEFFRTDNFSKIQGELVNLGMEIRTGIDKMMEEQFALYPILTRTEADELYKTIYDLRKRIHVLEQGTDAKETEAKPAPAKKEEAKAKKETTAAPTLVK